MYECAKCDVKATDFFLIVLYIYRYISQIIVQKDTDEKRILMIEIAFTYIDIYALTRSFLALFLLNHFSDFILALLQIPLQVRFVIL